MGSHYFGFIQNSQQIEFQVAVSNHLTIYKYYVSNIIFLVSFDYAVLLNSETFAANQIQHRAVQNSVVVFFFHIPFFVITIIH